MKSSRILSVLATGALAIGTLSVPAQAEYYSISDPDEGVASLTDITGFTARHGAKNLLVKVRFVDLRRDSRAGLSIFVDSDRARKGPELVLGSGLADGTDYALTRARRWKQVGDRIECDYDVQVKWRQDKVRARFGRDCFDHAGEVRVSVQMTDHYDSSHPITDWAPRARRWSTPIASAGEQTEA